MPAAAEERLLEYARTWTDRGVRAWGEGWWELPLTVGDQIARIVGAPPGAISMHQNVTIAEAIVLSCFEPGGERNRSSTRRGTSPRCATSTRRRRARGRGRADDAGVAEAIDERTLLVPVTHVLYKTGEIQDVEAIVARAHEHGALVVLDATSRPARCRST